MQEVSPTSGPVGSDVHIKGTGLSSVTSISVGQGSTQSFTQVSDTELRFQVPQGATTGVVIVSGPAGTVTSPSPFTVV